MIGISQWNSFFAKEGKITTFFWKLLMHVPNKDIQIHEARWDIIESCSHSYAIMKTKEKKVE